MRRWRGHLGPRADHGVHRHREEAPSRGSPRRTPGCNSSPLTGQFRGPAAGQEGGDRGPGLWEGASPSWRRGERPHTYLFLAPGRAGCLGCGPAWHSPATPRASRASAQRQEVRGRGRVRGHILRAGRDPESGESRQAHEGAGGWGAAREVRRLRRFEAPRPRSAAAPSGFSLPLLLFHSVGARFASVPQ